MTVDRAEATAAARSAADALAAGPGGRRARPQRRVAHGGCAYVVLIGYALLMFIPFAWSVITSFKTLPDSVRLTIIPAAVHDRRLGVRADEARPADLPVLFVNSVDHRRWP